jgi:RHS repeat-associated protein
LRRRYDAQDRLIAIAHLKQNGGTSTLILGQRIQRATGGAVSRVDRFDSASGFDATSGQFTGTPAEALSYSYDDSARLVAENRYTGSELAAWLADSTQAATERTTYQYDAVSNRSQKQRITAAGTETTQYAYDAKDRLLSETLTSATGSTRSTTYTWDANGNLASKQTPESYTGYLFDADNRLIEVRQGSSATTATSIARYRYDADGQRIAKTTTRGTTQYLIDPTTNWPQVAAEVQTPADGSATQSTAYVWGTSLLRQTRGGQGTLYAQASSDLIPLEGQLGTVLGAIDANGNLVEQYERDAFGNALDDTTAHAQLTHQYTGEYFDQDIGLQYNRARWYGPTIGRFISMDRFNTSGMRPLALNKYLYANSDSVGKLDPSGKVTLGEVATSMNAGMILYTVGMTSFHVAGDLNDGNLGKASSDLAVGMIEVAAFSAGPAAFRTLFGACAKWCTLFFQFSMKERAIIAEVKAIHASGALSKIKAALASSEEMEIVVGNGRVVLVQPNWLYSSGMTLREEGGFLVGKIAGSSDAELIKTFLHEIYRLEFEGGIQAGAVGVSTAATDAAFGFAEKAYALFTSL